MSKDAAVKIGAYVTNAEWHADALSDAIEHVAGIMATDRATVESHIDAGLISIEFGRIYDGAFAAFDSRTTSGRRDMYGLKRLDYDAVVWGPFCIASDREAEIDIAARQFADTQVAYDDWDD